MLRDRFYNAKNNPLQSLDLWLPSSVSGPEPVVFVVYIHGGAWTDPDQDKSEGHEILESIYREHESKDFKVACASINYRLSLPDTKIRHPDHRNDVARAINFLQEHYGLKYCLLLGHSAGATLAVQMLEQHRSLILGMVLFNGIYDLRALVDEYPSYSSFVTAAFGPDEADSWTAPSPTNIIRSSKVRRCYRNEKIVLAHSYQDELMSMHQTDLFETTVNAYWNQSPEKIVIGGKHDDSPGSTEMQEIARRTLHEVAQKLLGGISSSGGE